MGLYRRRKCGRGTGRACGEHSHRGGCEQPPRALGRAWPDPAGQRTLWAERDAGRGGPESGAAPTGHPVAPITSDTWTQQAQRAGTSPCAPRRGTSKLEPSASCPPGPPNMPTSAPKVHFPHGGPLTLSTPCPGLTPGPGVGPGSLWSQSCGISTHPGRLGLHPARQQQQQKQQQGQPRWGAGAGDPSPAPHGSSWAGVRSGGTREQGEGQGCRQMINPGCLPCWEVCMSAISAAQLTLPGPAAQALTWELSP